MASHTLRTFILDFEDDKKFMLTELSRSDNKQGQRIYANVYGADRKGAFSEKSINLWHWKTEIDDEGITSRLSHSKHF